MNSGSNMNTVLLIIVLILIVGGGIWWYSNYGAQKDTDQQNGLQVNLGSTNSQQ